LEYHHELKYEVIMMQSKQKAKKKHGTKNIIPFNFCSPLVKQQLSAEIAWFNRSLAAG
tara:strand:- start:401 stop:574 length:174 start_codon:yes stop_codon:yes gene_type:complete